MFCKQCGSQIDDGTVVCPSCGCNQQATEQFAQQNTQVPPQNQAYAQPQQQQYAQQPNMVVPNIVVNVDNSNSNTAIASNGGVGAVSTKSKTVALLLAIFFGWIGAHKFYVGKIGMGILYLLTCGLFGIGTLVDIVQICLGKFTDKLGLPLLR